MNKNLKEVQKEVKAKQQELIDLETKARKLKAEPKAKRFVNVFLASDEVCEALVNLTNAEVDIIAKAFVARFHRWRYTESKGDRL